MTFVVFALPRSRTFWASRFLSYADWYCGHDEIRHVRLMADVGSWLSMPHTGTVECSAAPWWRTLCRFMPDARIATIRRPVPEVMASLIANGLPYDLPVLERTLRYLDRKLDQIEARVPNVLSVRYTDLAEESGCAALFTHCLPFPHDPAWYRMFASVNLQANFLHASRYARAYAPQLERVTRIARKGAINDLREVYS